MRKISTLFFICLLALTVVHAQQTFSQDTLTVQDPAIYATAYVSEDGQDWQETQLQGQTKLGWVLGEATLQLASTTQYVAVYSCYWQQGWQCPQTWQILNRNSSQVSLVENNQPTADIIISSDAPNMVVLAAELLQEYIYNMTQATLPIRNTPGSDYDFHVYVGESEYTQQLGIDATGTRDEGFKIVADSNYLVLLGDDTPVDRSTYISQEAFDQITAPDYFKAPELDSREQNGKYQINDLDDRGSMNAVHHFLREQGIRWYHPNDFGVIIPQKDTLEVSQTNQTINPAFPMRALRLYFMRYGHLREGVFPDDYEWGSYEEQLRWVLALQKNNKQMYVENGGIHSLNAVTDREETRQNHPEYYAVWSGVRKDGSDGGEPKQNLCSEELKDATIRYAKHMFDTYDAEYASVWPSDGFTRVSEHSQECIDMSTPERFKGRISNYVWDFTNEVAWAIADDPNYGPEHKIIQGAYSQYQAVPTQLSDPRGMAPNVVVWVTNWRTSNADEEYKQYYENLINEWLEILPSNELLTYDYYLHHDEDRTIGTTPYFFAGLITENLRFLDGKSGGEFIEITGNWPGNGVDYDTYAAQAFNIWLTARLYWDPHVDVDALLDEYYLLYYGPASSTMKELYEYSEANTVELTQNPVHKNTMRELTEQALAQVPANSVYAQRIQNLLNMLNHEFAGDEAIVDSCQVLNSQGTTYKLQLDVSADETCFFIDANGVTLDCQGHAITYRTAGPTDSYGVQINADDTNRGHYSTIQNCNIVDGSIASGDTSGQAISVGHADYVNILDNNIQTAGDGIGSARSSNLTIRGNTVRAGDIGFGSFTGNSDNYGKISEYLVENNYFESEYRGAYLYRHTDDIIRNNTFVGGSGNGLRSWRPRRVLFDSNTYISESDSPVYIYQPEDIVEQGNTVVN